MQSYQVRARFESVLEIGNHRTVTEEFLVQAMSFGQAEKVVLDVLTPFASGAIEITAIARKNYLAILTSKSWNDRESRVMFGPDNTSTDVGRWFKCKLNITTINKTNGAEKKTPRFYLVGADTALEAHRLVDNFMSDSLSDYEVGQIDETKILDVFAQEVEEVEEE